VAANIYNASFLKMVGKFTYSMLDIVPKDKNGLHVVGADSPLADKFMDRFALGDTPSASRAYVQRLKQIVPDADLHSAIEAASLNKLRDAAGVNIHGTTNTTFQTTPYQKARNAMAGKADVLMSPQAAADTDHLRRVAGDVEYEGKGASTNRPNTAVTLQRFGAHAEPGAPTKAGQIASLAGDVAVGHMGPVPLGIKKFGQAMFKNSRDAAAAQALKESKMKFAEDATKPGAGLQR